MPDLKNEARKGRTWSRVGTVFLGLFVAGPASGQEFCSEPVTPYCVGLDAEFDTMLQINRCKDDLKNYEDAVDEYGACIERSLNRMREEIRDAKQSLEKAEQEY